MFGHDDKNQQEEHVTGDSGEVVQPMSTTPPDENVVGVTPSDDATTAPAAPATSNDDDDDINKIVDDINSADDTDEAETAVEHEQHEESVADTPAAEPASDTNEPTLHETPSDLQEVKKSALQELSPLLDELDQPDEEKLDILMMTIQATDDQSLIPQAFETAKRIQDKKARAEAMLDIIQEINYFTKKQ